MDSYPHLARQDRGLVIFLRAFGVLQVALGLLAAFYGPLEIYVFYLFSPGGRFAYDGFNIGSLWFAYLVIQNLGYYLVALILLPLGIGHYHLRRWTLPLTQAYLWIWLLGGGLLVFYFSTLVPALLESDLDRQTLLIRLSITYLFMAIALIALPLVLLRFYRSGRVKAIFSLRDPHPGQLDFMPTRMLVLLFLIMATILVLHAAIFTQAIVPLFGLWISGREGVYILALGIVILMILGYGVGIRRPWAWWGLVLVYSFLAISTTLTFSSTTLIDLVQELALPIYELEWMQSLSVFHAYSLLPLSLPLWIILGLILVSRRDYYPQV